MALLNGRRDGVPVADPPLPARAAAVVAGLALATALACTTSFFLAGRSADRDERVVEAANRDLTLLVSRVQVELETYLNTGATPYLAAHHASLTRLGASSRGIRQACRALQPAPARLEERLADLDHAIALWRSDYADLAIEYKLAKSRKLAPLTKKSTGPDRARRIGQALESVNAEIDGLLEADQAARRTHQRWLLTAAALGLLGFLAAGSVVAARWTAYLRDLRHRSGRLEWLATFAERVLHAGRADDAASFVAQALRRHLDADQGLVLFRNADGEGLRIVAVDGTLGPAAADAPLLADASHCPVMRMGQRVVVRHVDREPACGCPLGAPAVGGYACTPLFAQGRVVGLANWTTRNGRTVTAADLDHAESLARVTSLALSGFFSLDRAQREAITDQLTGVYNRRLLDEFLAKQLQGALREGHGLAVLLFDLDRFKQFNDTHGHQAGDALLKAFAAGALTCVREGDLVARYGGEEFVAVLPDAGRAEALEIAERIRAAAAAIAPAAVGLPSLARPVVTVSAGLAVAPEHGRHAPELLRAADEALYQAKESGRNRVVHATVPIG